MYNLNADKLKNYCNNCTGDLNISMSKSNLIRCLSCMKGSISKNLYYPNDFILNPSTSRSKKIELFRKGLISEDEVPDYSSDPNQIGGP